MQSRQLKAAGVLLWLFVPIAWGSVVSPCNAGYAILSGAPITQGQLRITEDDLHRIDARTPAATDRFVLKQTRVEVEISGVIARVRVEQVFQNPYSERLEALYVFPLPEDAAVDAYSIQIGERVIVGDVRKREDARRAYEQARDEGRTAALLEQDRPNLFSQSVANIAPNAEITVNIEYVHPVQIDGEKYAFRFPMVVGPRYIPGQRLPRPNVGRGWAPDTDEVPDASRITPEYLAPGMRNGNDVFINITLDAGMPIQEVTAVSHELEVTKPSETEAAIALKNQSTVADKDFVVEYRLAGAETLLASLTHRDADKGEDGLVSLVLQPKWNIEPGELAAREVIFVLDTSGSMNGQAISQLRIFAQHVLQQLNPQDSFRIVSFNNSPRAFRPDLVPAVPENIAAGEQFIRQLSAGGGTEMLSALKMALPSSAGELSRPRYLYLMTDALVGNDDSILSYIARPEFADARVFPIAFGAAPNHYVINRAAELGRGFAQQVTNQDNPAAIADRFNNKTSSPYMTDVDIDWGGLSVNDVIPTPLPDLYAGFPLVVMGTYSQVGNSQIALRGNVLGQNVEILLDLELPENEPQHDSLGVLWARQRVRQITNRDLGNPTTAGREEITQLGLTHQIVTQYTSFVAIEEAVPEHVEGSLRKESVPLMLPEGMTEQAVGHRRQSKPQQAASAPGRPHYAPPQRAYEPTNRSSRQSNTSRQSGRGFGGGSVDWTLIAGLAALGIGSWLSQRTRCDQSRAGTP